MAQTKFASVVTIGAILLGGLALVVVVAVCLQALYLKEVEVEKRAKSGLASHAEFAELTASQQKALENGFAVLERDSTKVPTRVRLPISTAMERALETARTSAP